MGANFHINLIGNKKKQNVTFALGARTETRDWTGTETDLLKLLVGTLRPCHLGDFAWGLE